MTHKGGEDVKCALSLYRCEVGFYSRLRAQGAERAHIQAAVPAACHPSTTAQTEADRSRYVHAVQRRVTVRVNSLDVSAGVD